MRKEQDIKAELSDLLKSEKPDYSAILSLSNELAQLDNEHVRFSVDAGLINRLGTELVSRQETAVSELVKNAYDADATSVSLEFVNSESIGGTLIISDDGNGMTREQLIDGFMRISSSDKIENPISPIYHRKRAGKKGIGRFAVQRLGTKLIIHTKSVESSCAYEVVINWDEYESHANLMEISHTFTSSSMRRTQAQERVLILNKKFGLDLKVAMPLNMATSSTFWTICHESKKPLDPSDGFQYRNRHIDEWLEPEYISLICALENPNQQKYLSPRDKDEVRYLGKKANEE